MSLRRPSLVLSGRQARGSLLIVALMLAAFGFVFANNIVPAWQEHQVLNERARALDEKLEARRETAKDLQDKIDSLNDPYDLAIILPNRHGWRWAENSEAWKTRHGMPVSTVQK